MQEASCHMVAFLESQLHQLQLFHPRLQARHHEAHFLSTASSGTSSRMPCQHAVGNTVCLKPASEPLM